MEDLKFAVIVSRYQEQWVFCKHRERVTYECPGGHWEAGEEIVETARRELYEETGAIDYTLWPVCVYSVTRDEIETFGILFYAEIKTFGELPVSEIEKVELFREFPDNWTYPEIQPKLFQRIEAFLKDGKKPIPSIMKVTFPKLNEMVDGETFYLNPEYKSFDLSNLNLPLHMEDIKDAEQRLQRFAPFVRKCFPETEVSNGIIESPLTEIQNMRDVLNQKYSAGIEGTLFLKQDNDLAVAGSIKARGGIYEILKHTEEIAKQENRSDLLKQYERFADPDSKEFFKQYRIHAGSTGNLGLSIGIISAALGYDVTIHMSKDAREWKKDLLRENGVHVKEYDADFSMAVTKGREEAMLDEKGHFVDDENSRDLFLGYAVAALRLEKQLRECGITIDQDHPLFVYLPCGVGGAPGGITFGLKQIFGDFVHCFFVEPVQSPSMLLGMVTKLHNQICVKDIGLSGKTLADGLAVGRPSKFVGKLMEPLLAGIFTVEDGILYEYMRELLNTENIFIEPSSCAAFHGVSKLLEKPEVRSLLKEKGLEEHMGQAVHVAWATGGKLVPQEIRKEYIHYRGDK